MSLSISSPFGSPELRRASKDLMLASSLANIPIPSASAQRSKESPRSDYITQASYKL